MSNHTVHKDGTKKSGTKRRFVALFSFIGIGIIVLVAVLSIGVTRFFSGISEAQQGVEDVAMHVEEFDVIAAKNSLTTVATGLKTAESGIKFFRWSHGIPWFGDHVQAVELLLSSGIVALESVADISHAIERIADAVEEVERGPQGEEVQSFFQLSEHAREQILVAINDSWGDLLKIDARMRVIERQFSELDELHLSPAFEENIQPLKDGFEQVVAFTDVVVPLSGILDEVAGIGEGRQWLILFMNDMELRPGGGFLGVYGIANVRNADIVDLEVSDTYALDVLVEGDDTYQVAPPEPIRTYTGVGKWYFRDANWSPDFAESARVGVQLLRQEYAQSGQAVPEINGVIGFTPTFASWLLEVTGPIEVNGEVFTTENLPQKLEFEVEEGYVEDGIPWDQRKAIVGGVTEELIDALKKTSVEDLPKLASIFVRGFTQKQIALFSFDERTQATIRDAGWSGEVPVKGVDDTLLVVDANMHALKTDPTVERSIDYGIRPENGRYIATVTLQYDHLGEYDFYTTRYRDYVRVYAPEGSEFISVEGIDSEMNQIDELGLTSFGGFFAVEPGEMHTVTWQYYLPDSINEAVDSGLYELRVHKQMGAQNNALTLHLDFDKNMKAAHPPEDPSNFGNNIYELSTILDQNLEFVVQIES